MKISGDIPFRSLVTLKIINSEFFFLFIKLTVQNENNFERGLKNDK